jgi:hypothetical protein
MMYVYKRTEPNLWTVGFYHGDKWEPDSDHDSPSKAAKRVRYLNGGQDAAPELLAACEALLAGVNLVLSIDGFSMPSARQAKTLAEAIDQAHDALARARSSEEADGVSDV